MTLRDGRWAYCDADMLMTMRRPCAVRFQIKINIESSLNEEPHLLSGVRGLARGGSAGWDRRRLLGDDPAFRWCRAKRRLRVAFRPWKWLTPR